MDVVVVFRAWFLESMQRRVREVLRQAHVLQQQDKTSNGESESANGCVPKRRLWASARTDAWKRTP